MDCVIVLSWSIISYQCIVINEIDKSICESRKNRYRKLAGAIVLAIADEEVRIRNEELQGRSGR